VFDGLVCLVCSYYAADVVCSGRDGRQEEGKGLRSVQGYVKWFDSAKGYGFITAQDGNDYFVHYSAIDREGYKTIDKDRDVEFEIEINSENKTRAINVKELEHGTLSK
jgi:cold shock protein